MHGVVEEVKMERWAPLRSLLEAEYMVYTNWDQAKKFEMMDHAFQKIQMLPVCVAFYLVLDLVLKIPHSRGVATLNQDYLETKYPKTNL